MFKEPKCSLAGIIYLHVHTENILSLGSLHPTHVLTCVITTTCHYTIQVSELLPINLFQSVLFHSGTLSTVTLCPLPVVTPLMLAYLCVYKFFLCFLQAFVSVIHLILPAFCLVLSPLVQDRLYYQPLAIWYFAYCTLFTMSLKLG